MSAEPEDKRQFHRIGHDARASLSHGADVWSCTVQDLSLKGCLVRMDDPVEFDPGQTYRLSVHLTYAIHIEMDVRLSHQDGLAVGFTCHSIDSESIAKLKRLVELNLGDSELLDREMHILVSGE